jgi:membrane protein required for colicin V production
MDSPFSVVDAFVIIFTFLSTILAMARGATREILGIASLIIANFLAILFADSFAPLLNEFVNLKPLAEKFAADVNVISAWLAGGTLFIVLWIIFTVIAAKLSRLINDSAVSGVDSMLGLVFGIVRGLFIVGIIYTLYTHFIPPEKYFEAITNAKLKPLLDDTSDIIINFSELILPENISNGFSKNTQAVYPDSHSTPSN